MPVTPLTGFHVNPVLDELLHYLANKYIGMYPGFVAFGLFGSQATGSWVEDSIDLATGELIKGSDVDVGLITDDISQINTMKLFWDIYKEFKDNKFELCTHNNPDELVLNMDYNKKDLIRTLEVYTAELAQVKDFHTIRGKVEERKLFEIYPFCLPFGKVYGIRPRIENAQSYVYSLIQSTQDQQKAEAQLKRALSFMYHN